MKHAIHLIPVFLLATLAASHPVAAATKRVKVFILAGQSNMEGAGQIKTDPKRNGGKGAFEFLVKDAATAKHFATLVDSAGQWRTRDDVWISYLDRKGPLTVGFGARKDETIGPELGFGLMISHSVADAVLLSDRIILLGGDPMKLVREFNVRLTGLVKDVTRTSLL